MPTLLKSFDQIRDCAKQGFIELLWVGEEFEKPDPVLLDSSTAQAMVLVHDVLNEKAQSKFRDMVLESRGRFLVAAGFCWKHVSFGGAK